MTEAGPQLTGISLVFPSDVMMDAHSPATLRGLWEGAMAIVTASRTSEMFSRLHHKEREKVSRFRAEHMFRGVHHKERRQGVRFGTKHMRESQVGGKSGPQRKNSPHNRTMPFDSRRCIPSPEHSDWPLPSAPG